MPSPSASPDPSFVSGTPSPSASGTITSVEALLASDTLLPSASCPEAVTVLTTVPTSLGWVV